MTRVPHPIEILFGAGTSLACGIDGEVRAEALHGLFAGDTRVLSTYRFTIAGFAWRILSRTRPGPSTAQWDLQNPSVRLANFDLEEGTLHCRVRRRVIGALHDCLTVTSFAAHPATFRIALQIDADFADIFEVKQRAFVPRLSMRRTAHGRSLSLAYEHRGFSRGLHVTFDCAEMPTLVGTQIVFDLVLEPRRSWRCCIEMQPELDGARVGFEGDPHAVDVRYRAHRDLTIAAPEILAEPFEQGCLDLDRLALRFGDEWFIAAGTPWFLALFGRDTLVTSLMAGLLGSWHARGALEALRVTQADRRDDARDAEPGKIAHELRRGELAYTHAIPHTPYFGTHDAPALYVLALWNAYRWTGRRELLDTYLATAEAALEWCERAGDEDGDGFLEYRTRSRKGYFNQGWKDAEDAILHADGSLPPLPLGTVELQAYWYAARLAMAELYDELGDRARAAELREAAVRLRAQIEERYWMTDAGCYAIALDGNKQLVATIGSNPGHLLWCGVPTPERAASVARRLLAPDMFSGYGVRTMSADHALYNPLSYQLGSVWPHDSALFAAGLARYGMRDEAARVVKGILDAGAAFEAARLPELFCGFSQDDGAPVPYERANVPQAWAAASPILAAQIFVGLVPDAPRRRCFVAPSLPAWLPVLELAGIDLAGAPLAIKIVRDGEHTRIDYARHPAIEIVRGVPPAPLWGAPITSDRPAAR